MSSPPRILLVEDNPDHTLIAEQALEFADDRYEVESCRRYDECLNRLRREPPDLLLIDYSLPDRDGLELMRAISRLAAPPPMIMVTGQGDEAIAVGAMKLGAYDYLVKGRDFQSRLPVVVKQALERHTLRAELERSRESILRRNRELTAVNMLNAAIRRPRDPAEVREVALATLFEVLGADCGIFHVAEAEGDFAPVCVHCRQGDLGERLAGHSLPPESPARSAAEAQQALLVRITGASEPGASLFPPELLAAIRESGLLHWALLPVVAETRPAGVILLGSTDPTFPAIEDPEVLTTLGGQVAIAHENARLYCEVERAAGALEAKVEERTRDLAETNTRLDRQVEQLGFLQDFAQHVTQELDVDEILSRVCVRAPMVVAAEWAGIAQYDDVRGGLVYTHHNRMPEFFSHRLYRAGEGATGTAWAERRSIHVPRPERYDERMVAQPAAGMVLPLIFKDTVLGVLTVASTDAPRSLTADEQDLLRLLANQVAVALANARLFEELRAKAVELSAANDKLRLVDRRKTAFLAAMSHELRTPLNSIIGFTGAILKGLSGPINEEQDKQLTIVYESARNLLDLINELLDLSKIESGRIDLRRERFELAPLVAEVGEICERLVDGAPIVVHVGEVEGLSELRTDRGKLRQILLNLVSNAAKYTDRGRIELITAIEAGAALDQNEAQASAVLRISVIDSGRGIPPTQLDHVFDEFHRAEAEARPGGELSPGAGLGLPISQKLAYALGGRIVVASQRGQGSNFSLLLPLERITDTDAAEG